MKIRMLALAGVAAVALSAPAHAAEGWYLGLGGGYDNMSNLRTEFDDPVPPSAPRMPLQPERHCCVSQLGYGWASACALKTKSAMPRMV